MDRPKYISWFVKEEGIVLEDGFPITCYKLDYLLDESALQDLALHIRRHYESDELLCASIKTTGMTSEDYLRQYVIPQKAEAFGSTARSSDFTEIMISDLLQFIYGFKVPRCKQANRSGKNNSEHGTDILAYKFFDKTECANERDKLLAVEVKGGLTSPEYEPIRKAVTDSKKYDPVRYSLTLNYYRKKLCQMNRIKEAMEIARFQQKSEYDYVISYAAAAIISRDNIDKVIAGLKGEELELRREDDTVFLVHGQQLMNLVHEIYERCTK